MFKTTMKGYLSSGSPLFQLRGSLLFKLPELLRWLFQTLCLVQGIVYSLCKICSLSKVALWLVFSLFLV